MQGAYNLLGLPGSSGKASPGGRGIETLNSTWQLNNALDPRVKLGEFRLEINLKGVGASDPAHGTKISNGNMVTNKEPRLVVLEARFQHRVQSAGLVSVALNAIGNLFGRKNLEMVGLALHGTNTSVLEEKPLEGLVVLGGAMRVRDLVVLVVLVSQVD